MARLSLLWLTFLLYHSTFLFAQNTSPTTPPAPYSITVNQPDGQTLRVISRGSAYNHWMVTEDGYAVMKNQLGFYEYATAENGQIISTGILATNPSDRSIFQQRKLLGVRKGLSKQLIGTQGSASDHFLTINSNARSNSAAVVPTQGNVKILAILIEYPDMKHKYEKEDFLKLFNGPSDKPTFKSYFQKNSHGNFDPTVDVAGWYQAKNDYAYYGEKYGKGRARELVVEALKAALDDDIDFTKYDNTNNGNVDGVMIIHAGMGDEEGGGGDYIWSHRSSISPLPLINGNSELKFAKDYTIQPEVRARYNSIVGIGIFCHEFGHLLGLPDLYDTDGTDDQHYGIGEWGLMGLGGWLGKENHPAGMSAFSKEKLGWASVRDITEQAGSYELKPADSSGEVFKITTPNSNEYFLLENRQKEGTDEYLNGAGMAIWHVDSERTNRYPESIHVNNRRDFKGVDLEEADGENDLDYERNRGDEGDLFPGSSYRTEFNDTSDPNSNLYEDRGEGTKSGATIANIQLSEGIITFDYEKKEDESGSSCELAVNAQDGENTLPKENYWYTFTLPKEGRLVIQNANATIYRSCDESLLLASSANGQLTTAWLTKGETVKIKLGDKQSTSLPLIWNLSIDNKKIDPALTIEAIAAKTYGSRPFDLNVSFQGDGKTSYQKVSGPIELTGRQVSITGAGTAKIKVVLEETDEYSADELEVVFQINKAISTLTFTQVADKTYGDIPFTLQVTSTPEFIPTFTVKKGSVTIEGNTVTIVDAGEVEIESSTSGDSNYRGDSKTVSFTVKKAPQTIDFNALDDVVYQAGKEIKLTAESDQGLPITFSVKEGSVDLDEQSLVVQQAGIVTVEASQAGNKNILAASVERSFEITKATQTIRFSEIEDKLAGDKPFNLEATSSVDIPVEFTLISGNASLDGNQVIITGSGEITIEAYNEGNENYLAVRERQSFVVAEPSKQNQVVTLVALPDTVEVDEVVNLEITVSSGLNPDIDLVGSVLRNEKSLTFTQAGEVTLAIGQPGNDEYNPARTVSHTFVVVNPPESESPLGTNTQIITYQLPDNPVFGDNPFSLAVESSSELPLVYEVEGPAEIADGTLTITGAGEVTIRAFQAGNEEYAPSDTIEFSFTVSKASQVVTLDVIPAGDNTFQIKANSDSKLPVTVVISEGEGTLEDGILTVINSKVIVMASQEGNDNYMAAESITRELITEVITSIEGELNESEIIFYPNPGEGLFSVRIKKELKSVPFQVFDLRGAVVIQGMLQSVQPTIDLTNQRSGTYFLQMQLPNNTKQYRLIKQ